MDKCREAFEAKYRELNPNDKCTLMANGNYSGWIKQAHWWAWQSRQAELDQAYADIETFAQAHQRECDIRVQIANELKEKDKRIADLELALTQIKSWESHPKNYETDFGAWGLRDFYRDLADKALRGEHEA
jgi:septal ring factor EnvC (AmiA/AmiB activator)